MAAMSSRLALAQTPTPVGKTFTIAVIPDTQNYLDYSHQKSAGYPFDAKAMFLEQMQYVSDHLSGHGGDIAFVTALGDVWQHQTLIIDPAHEARGYHSVANPFIDKELGAPGPRTREIEMPSAKEGYRRIAGATPFSVVPGQS
jgi:hypothetical protein